MRNFLKYLVPLLLVFNHFSYGQCSDSLAVHKVASVITDVNSDSTSKAKAMQDLLDIYIRSENKFITAYSESIFIKATNLAAELFFHEFELLLSEKSKANISQRKKVRLSLIMSSKGNGYDYKYREFAVGEIDKEKDQHFGISKQSCSPDKFVPRKELLESIKKKDYEKVNNHYLSLLYTCSETEPEIRKVKMLYFSAR